MSLAYNLDDMTLWMARLAAIDAEVKAPLLSALGLSCVEIKSEDQIACYFETEGEDVGIWTSAFEEFGFKILEYRQVAPQNWLKACEELWTPLELNRLRIVPISQAGDQLLKSNSITNYCDIYIVPGLGFGTGHHSSTKLMLQFLEMFADERLQIAHALDVGTGSGILALASARLFGCQVDACDTDSDALMNAAENIAMNGLTDQIKLNLGSKTQGQKAYDLVMANIYAEVLLDLEPNFNELVKDSGSLLLSGVMGSLSESVKERYERANWSLIEMRCDKDWYALHFKPKIHS